jgi:hypothetical protein
MNMTRPTNTFESHAFADEGVAEILRQVPTVTLDFDEGADLGFVPNHASIKIDEGKMRTSRPSLTSGAIR